MKKVTVKDIAKMANVSTATVSYVLNNVQNQKIPEETRLRVLEAVRQLKYVPNLHAKSLISGKSGLIGIFVPWDSSQGSWKPFAHAVFVSEVERMLAKQGYHLLVSYIDFSRPDFQIILERMLEGAFILDIDEDVFYKISYQFSVKVPILLIDSYLDDTLFHKVVYEYRQAFSRARELLGGEPEFLILERLHNKKLLEDIQTLSGVTKDRIFIVDGDLQSAIPFLKEHGGKPGIVMNEFIANYALRHMESSRIAVLCTCGYSDLLPDDVAKVIFDNKAEAAVKLMLEYIGRNYDSSRENDKYTMVGIR